MKLRTRSYRQPRSRRTLGALALLLAVTLALQAAGCSASEPAGADENPGGGSSSGAASGGSTTLTETAVDATAADEAAVGPQPPIKSAGADSAADIERSYALLGEESDRLRTVIEERGTVRTGKHVPQMSWPVAGTPRVSSPFGPRKHPVLGREIQHEGIDLALEMSSPVKAAADGTVIWVVDLEEHGRTLVLDCGNGLTCVYCHLSRPLVSEGAHVKRGQVIAKSGMTGLATGPHLHFEVRSNGEPKNPRDYLPSLAPQTTVSRND